MGMAVLVKICGITNVGDALAALAAGADFLGFVLVPGTPRQVTSGQAAAIIREIRACAVADRVTPPRLVGVFQDASEAEIQTAVAECGFDVIQLHGDEPDSLVQRLGPERVWKMLPLRTPQDVARAAAHPASAVLADAVRGAQRGGTGAVCDWELAAAVARQRRLVLAGGLTPENIAAAVAQVRPWAVDVGSGVEAAKGKKDHAKIQSLIQAVRRAGGQTQNV
jgi:phosphoribosylanthranilate isomerase